MSRSELLDSAKKIENTARELLEKTNALQTEVGASLQAAKRFESRLISKERAERAERLEREKAERLMEYLNSEEQHGVYVSDRDSAAEEAAAETNDVAAAEPNAADTGVKSDNAADSNDYDIAAAKNDSAAEVVSEIPAEIKHSEATETNNDNAAELDDKVKADGNVDSNEKVQTNPVKESDSKLERATERTEKQSAPESDSQGNPPYSADAKSGKQGRTDGEQSRERTTRTERPQRGSERNGDRDGSRREDSRQGERRPRGDRSNDRDGYRSSERNGERNSDRPQRERSDGRTTSDRSAGDRTTGDRRFGENRQNDRAPRGDRPPRTDRAGTDFGKDKDASSRQSRPQTGRPMQRKPAADAPMITPKENRNPENKNTYVRTFDNEKKAKNKKTIMKETAPSAKNWDDEGSSYRKRRTTKQQEVHKPEPVVIEKAVITTETITVRDFSEKIGKPAAEIIKKLFMMGIIASINQDIDFDTCELIAMDYNIELEHQVAKTYEETMQEVAEEADAEESLVSRPPVVTIMGHVDHGKTSLLDAIRNSSITAGEAGGITQHIGAYTVNCKGRMITFIDTPGHEAFTSMRARGAQVTDVVILVVAADDGIMPQTIEAINHSKAAEVPIIVAINKMDKPEANPDRVKQQLTEYGLVCEDWGGETICVPVSAKKQTNLDTLLEMVLLQADVMELRANPNRAAKGTIIEAQLDKGRGPVATVLVQNGTLKVGDPIVAGIAYGRVRAMTDDKGRTVKTAGPSQPVEVLGFNEVPSAGDVMNVAEVSKKVAEERRNKIKAEQLKNLSKVSLEDLFSHIAEGEIKNLNIVIKADVHGSVEAVRQALEKLSNEEVRVKCIHGGVGAISESDVMFASASNAIVIGFNVRPDSGARALAEQEKVDVRTYRIIYQAIEDVENAMKGMFKPVYKEVHLGTVSVRETFKVSGVGTIAGAYVQDGKVQRSALVRVVRDGVVIHEGQIASLRRFKDDVKEVASGYECGIGIESFNDIHEGDSIEAYIMEEVKR
ncbi:MAG: translation initiation factor IF-2 [Christensenellaceae bacterium]|nr:translation initiation factor IF-2 [Christensenellaceae bacterium]